jgi:hypothetical protein
MDAGGLVGRGSASGRWAALGGDLGPALRDALGLFASLRLVFGLFALYVWWQGSLPGPCHFELARDGWQTIPPLADHGPAFPLVGVWQRWDACWYTKIATYGYESAENSVNFWPLFPLLTGLVGRLLLGAMALGGLVVAGFAYIVAMTGLRRLVALDFDDETALTTTIAISIFPTAFFFFAPFTESLFLAAAVWAILAARRRLWLLAAAAALLASLTRIQGVFLVLPLGWEAVMSWRAGGWTVDGGRPSVAGIVRPALAALAPLAGFVAFLVFSTLVAGKTPLDTQEVWGGKSFHPPWEVVDASWTWAIVHHDPLQALNLVTLLFFAVVSLVGLRRVPVAYSLYAIPQIVLIGTRIQPTPLTSTARYLLVVFPVFVILALVPDRRLRLLWAIGSAMFLALLLASFLHGDYVA